MTPLEIEGILQGCLRRKPQPYAKPEQADWNFLKNKFHCIFSEDFISFHEQIGQYQFYGDLLSITGSGATFTHDTVALVYDHEMSHGAWPKDMLPFYAVGNGDYVCLSISRNETSPVYYVDHEETELYIDADAVQFEEIYHNFAAWIQDCASWLSD